MKAIQYTVRNIPEPVNIYLRKKSDLSGKSLNQTIIDELSEVAGINNSNIVTSLDWFIGSGIDSKTLQALADEDAQQKKLFAKDL